ncbi:MAG: serpin family protein, partial [Gracilimonas sp.]
MKIRYSIFAIIITTILLAFPGCTDNVTGADENDDSKLSETELATAVSKLSEADHTFSTEIFRRVVIADEAENVFISPLSISIALGMTMNGAKGETYEEMKET